MADAAKTVAITGASGYLASHVVDVFVKNGYSVRGTVRDPSNKVKVGHLENLFPDIKLYQADLLEEGSFKECFSGCDLVIHCASPFQLSVSDPQKDLIDPALKGTTNVMETALECGVKRVVVTSSCAAVMSQDSVRDPSKFEKKIWTEEDWNDESTLTEGPYRMSKSLAEHKAWEYKEKLEVAVINPAFILGPPLSNRLDAVSVRTMVGMLNGTLAKTGVNGGCFGAVDVRDCALAHYRAATIPEAKNNRFILSTEDSFDILQLTGQLRPKFNSYSLPSTFKEGVQVAYRPYYSNKKAREILKIDFTPMGIAVNDMADAILSKGMVKMYTVYYWGACKGFWGRAAGIILSLNAAGVPYTIKEQPEAPFDLGFAVPMVTLPSGQTISQTPAILTILGQKLNLLGPTEEAQNLCRQSIMDINDIFGECKKFTEKQDRADKWFTLLENRVSNHKFLACDEPTVADFHAMFAFASVFKNYFSPEQMAEKYPKVGNWWANLQQVPAVKAMNESGIPIFT